MEFSGISNKRVFDMVQEYSHGIDLDKIGHFSGLDSDMLEPDKKEKICKTLVSCFCFRNFIPLSRKRFSDNMLSSVTIREIQPTLDFLDGNCNFIKSDFWKQTPNPFSRTMMTNKYKYGGIDYYDNIYKTNINTRMDMKCMCIYGVYIPEDNKNTDEIQIWRHNKSLIDRMYLDGHKQRTQVYLHSPILMNCDQPLSVVGPSSKYDYDIKFKFIDKDNSKKQDHIKILGYVVEHLGVNSLGS
jgi:hypothetical protein